MIFFMHNAYQLIVLYFFMIKLGEIIPCKIVAAKTGNISHVCFIPTTPIRRGPSLVYNQTIAIDRLINATYVPCLIGTGPTDWML